jgi:hypothetical protein
MEDPYAYYVPQTPRDSSRRNTFFHRSSPSPSKQPSPSAHFITSLQDGLSTAGSRLRNITRSSDAEPPLQLRVDHLENTMDSVHSTVTSLETTMSEIVTMLRHSHSPTKKEEAKWTQTQTHQVPRKPHPVTSPQATTIP